MDQVEEEYAQDDITIDLSFENAELDFELLDEATEESKDAPQTDSERVQISVQQVKETLQSVPNTDSNLQAHISTIADYLVQLEEKVRDLTVKNAMQTIDLHNLRQLYQASIEENEALATKKEAREAKEANKTLLDSNKSSNQIKAQLQEYMELDMEVQKAKQDNSKLTAEHERVVELCAKFQEEVLLKEIEVAKSDKRLHIMAAQLDNTKELHEQVVKENADLRAQMEAMATQNQTLLKHKKLLVLEVKALQKYSHVNIAGLEQEAQEARMMQKSISAQLERAQEERDELKEKLNELNISGVDTA
ncbi:unnamed protein product [Aphanomyces euteiches]|uniref:Uncharacterized protein n=1 Tax=Aphanomyces euteiches TaxID=100861 RepID=A0A6G0XET7_9STRA|nr:hypothetical protein Ae201684_005340 [Aphanomyces euteiches]KAH9093101.1 hypothetical protein Ae201684P_008765 [Aphanomyces euteiches]KAH9154718.1 hypothetical protein AeRB84_003225 [Aphanomyces euteiches]